MSKPWSAFTFDGLDNFAASEPSDTVPQTPTPITPGQVSVNVELVDRFMSAVKPHIQQAVSAGIADGLSNAKKTSWIVGLISVGITAALITGVWVTATRVGRCCPRKG